MREGGTVVAAVVAVLEKQQHKAASPGQPNRLQLHRQNMVAAEEASPAMRKCVPPKNSLCLGRGDEHTTSADHNFQSAVKDFDSIAEDVEKIVLASSGSLQRHRNGIITANGVDLRKRQQEVDEEEDRKSSDDFSSSEESDSDGSTSEVEGEHVIEEGLETIVEEDRHTASSTPHSFRGSNDDSSIDEESTLKNSNNTKAWSESLSNHGSTSDLSSTSSERPTSLRDSSTRCNGDFQWIRKEVPRSPRMDDLESVPTTKPPINRPNRDKTSRRDKPASGSLDRRRSNQQSRQERDQKSRSTHALKSPPREDFTPCQGVCCNPHEGYCYENFHRRHERLDPQRYGSSPMLMEQQQRYGERGSHSDIYGEMARYRHDSMGCCTYHMLPPCCYYDNRTYRWTPPPYSKPGEQDERFRKLQYERDNLQLQVQVLTEQIEAQSDKISDLEKLLLEKKQFLSDAEDKLQREVLSRSSLETQKLELMTIMSELKLQHAALERENHELRSSHYNNNAEMKKPPLLPRMSPQPQTTSTPIPHLNSQGLNMRMSPSPSPVGISSSNSPRRIESSIPLQQDSQQQPKTPPANYKRQIDVHFGSLPRQQFIGNGSSLSVVDSNANPAGMANGSGARKGVAFAETEKIVVEDGSSDTPGSPLQFNKNKGIKKIFGRMKRSGSGNLEDLPGVGEFQRGGVRATAAARLGWSEPHIMPKPDKPFAEWDTENICDWMQDLGLDQYIAEAKRWVKNGQQLQEAAISEIEKELNIKNPLHRKKIQLALIDTHENSSSDQYLTHAGKLDTAWVLRWLDDTGLPQHKESFLINRVDGRVLHRLTVDDLALLHVTSMLHVASIKRGIQVLRDNNYEPGCLQRRSLPEDPTQPTPQQISLWTTHRVMEWLRAVDLAEYAPNLRGAGVHGGLMVLETKFTAELLASLLSIPPSKTLLRRHLNTHFKELLGKDIIQEKREAEAVMGYIPLTPSSKLKVAKKSQFSLKRKKSKGEADYGDLVCPLNPEKLTDDEDGRPRGRGCLSSR